MRYRAGLLYLAALIGTAGSAAGADLPAPSPAVASAKCFASFRSFLDSTPLDCPLQWNGLTLYGTIDMGGGHSSHGAKFNGDYPQGVQEVIAKFSKGPIWQFVPNGLQRSNVGVSAKWQVAPSWWFIGNINTDFDPYSLRLSNGPASLVDNNISTLANQTANGDSNRAGQFDNTQGYVGVSNTTWGTLTAGRLNTFSADLVTSYDPMQGSYAFSLIGNSATYVSGVGATETTRYESAVKYLWTGDKVHAGAIGQFGGYSLGNPSDGAFQFDVGGSLSKFSIDAVYSYARDAVALSLYGANPLPAGVAPDDLRATLADINGGILAAKYDLGSLKFYGGYEYAVFSPPSDPHVEGFQSIGDFKVLPNAVNSTTYVNNKRLQVAWIGAKYTLLSNVDLAGAYYIAHQNNYAPSTAKAGSCGPNTLDATPGASPQGTLNTNCAGDLQAVSALVDYRPVKRVDIYGGAMYSIASGGIASGYIHSNNLAETVGLRFSF